MVVTRVASRALCDPARIDPSKTSKRRGGALRSDGIMSSLRTHRIIGEPNPAVTVVTERLVLRGSAAADRHSGIFDQQRAVGPHNLDAAADEQRSVWCHLDCCDVGGL